MDPTFTFSFRCQLLICADKGSVGNVITVLLMLKKKYMISQVPDRIDQEEEPAFFGIQNFILE